MRIVCEPMRGSKVPRARLDTSVRGFQALRGGNVSYRSTAMVEICNAVAALGRDIHATDFCIVALTKRHAIIEQRMLAAARPAADATPP